MPVRALASLVGALIVAAIPLTVDAQVPDRTSHLAGFVDVASRTEAGDLGVRPVGIGFDPGSQTLLVTGPNGAGNGTVQGMTTFARLGSAAALPAGMTLTPGTAFDALQQRLVTAVATDALVSVPASGGHLVPGARGAATSVRGISGLRTATGAAIDAAGRTLVLAPDGRVSVISGATVSRQVSLAAAGEALRGLAIRGDGHLFSIGAASRTLYEFDAVGSLVSSRNLSSLGIADPQGMVFAPSADSTDAAPTTNLFLADAGRTDGTGGGVVELSLATPTFSPALAAAPTTLVSLVKTVNTGSGSALNPDSPDPSGLAYIPAGSTSNPARNDKLVIVDGEVEETTGAGFHNANAWWAVRSNISTSLTEDTTKAPTSPIDKEPVGAAYDPVRNELYIVRDGGTSRVWVYNAATMAQVRTFDVAVAPYNDLDAEGLGFGGGVLYMVDAKDNDLVKVLPGNNGIVGSGNDDQVFNYDLQQYGQMEPEGLDVHPVTGNIWIVSNHLSGGNPDPMLEMTPNGMLVSTSSIAAANPNSAAGLTFAPPSAGGSDWNIYISDRMLDNSQTSTENDGRIYEFSIGGGGGNTPPTADPVADTTPQNTPKAITLSGSDSDSGDCELTFSIVSIPANGSLGSISNNACVAGTPNTDSATVTYTPNQDFTGSDSFTYKVNDGTVDSAPATVTITVTSTGGGGIVLRSAASGTNTGTTTLVLPRPSGTASGDVLLAAVTVRGTPTISAAGWTLVRLDSRSPTFTQAVFWHLAGASEPSSYTFTFNSSQTAVGTIVAYGGVDNVNPIADKNGQVTSSSATITAPTVTTTVPNTQLVSFFGIVGKTTIGQSSGMTERAEVFSPKGTTSKLTASLDDQPMAAAGASGNRTATAGVSAHNIGQLVALKPA